MKSVIYLIASAFFYIFSSSPMDAACAGKVDAGVVFVHVDILNSGHTVKRMDMWGTRIDGSYMVWKGLFVKPTFLYANGGAAKGGLLTAGFGIGHYTPINSTLAVSPLLGMNYSHVWTKIDIPAYGLENLNEKFKAWAPYIGLEACCNLNEGWRVYGSIQYAWSRSKTIINSKGDKLVDEKSSCKGPTYSFLIEKDLSEVWSVNLGGAYNLSLSKERHGLRASGIKAGIVRWF